jgi:streptogrisin C
MKPLKLGGACVVVVLVFATALAASAYANTPSTGTTPMIVPPPSLDPTTSAEVAAVSRSGISLPRAEEAIAVQSAVERSDLVNQLQAALGGAYGGAWYVPAAAQLAVGVTSQSAARIAEAVAVRAGLGSSVTEVPVRSSEARLSAVQKEWNLRLSGLLARGEVATQASVEDNSVHIELGSDVSAGERAALEGAASEAPVDVVVTAAPRSKLRVKPEARCRGFEPNKAFCDPQIVSGTRLEDPAAIPCTTGPAVVPPKGSTETYVLTAGHCVEEVGESFFSFNKAGKKEEVGKAAAFLSEAAGNNVDVAAIKVEKAFWTKAGEVPLTPSIAEWKEKAESEPFVVKGEVAPAAKAATCISGQTTGFHCGTIKATRLTYGKLEELVEVEGAKTEGGDSGSPWFSKEEKLVQGTHVGKAPNAEKNPVFEPLQFSFKRLKEVSKLELELLIEKNEKRM